MAAGSLLALLDDIALILDDVAVMTKIAAKKTAGVLGDDLALNAEQVSGVKADRELPVVWAVAKGSAKNKLILVPSALLISAFVPWLITPLLIIGGLFLCFEGVEKVLYKFLHSKEGDDAHHEELVKALVSEEQDMVAFEQKKIRGAIQTDFILSAEIIVISLGAVQGAAFLNQVLAVIAIAVLMTVGVYGLVAGIVKLDDGGLALSKSQSAFIRSLGDMILWFAPALMKGLSLVGTLAMFMVGGGILAHGLHFIGHGIELISLSVPELLAAVLPTLLTMALGFAAGALVLLFVSLGKKLWTPRDDFDGSNDEV